MVFHFEEYNIRKIIKSIATKLNVSSKTDCLEEIVTIPKVHGSGKVEGFDFSDGISLLIFNCTIKQDWTLVFNKDCIAPLQFNFNVKGNVQHALNDKNIQYQLNPLQGTITAHPFGTTQILQLPQETELLINCLMIDRNKYAEKIQCILEEMPQNLSDVFLDIEAKNTFFYQSNYSISIAGCIKKIISDKNEGLVRSTFLEGKTLELFSKQIKQYQDDLRSPGRQVMLRKYDLDKIKAAKELLISDIINPPTIEELAKQIGINRQKLKVGFKKVYEKTISKYLRDERMERASVLLLHGLSVRETASEVGYINQSHFAKRFRERYGVLPKDYLKTFRSKLSD